MNASQLSLSIPDYDTESIERKIGELSQYVVQLPQDPSTVGGFDGINKLFAVLQGYLDRVNELVSEAIKWRASSKAAASAYKHSYEAKRAAMISAKGQQEYESIKILEAQVDDLLAEDKRLMQRAELTAGLFDAYHKIVEGKYKNLESAKKTLEMLTNNWKRQNPLPPPVIHVGSK